MIVVTGATGLLGAELLRQLLEDNSEDIVCTYNNTEPAFFLNNKNVKWVKCNLLDFDAVLEILDGAKYVYHCAALVSFDDSDSKKLFHNNIEATANIVNASLEIKIEKFLHVSSVATLGRVTNTEMISENTLWQSSKENTAYSISKHKAEMEVWRASAEGLNMVIVNPSIIFGESDWNKSSTALFKNVYNEFPFYTNGVNGFVDVKDVARAMVLLMKSEIKNERFIINAGNFSYKEIFEIMAKYFNKKKPKYEAKLMLSKLAVFYFSIIKFFFEKKPLITSSSVRVANAKYYYNNSKFLKLFPEYKYTEMATTIERIALFLLNKYKA